MLQIQHLIKYYGKKQILHDVSFKLDPGDICAFIGSNGAGKTTTIKSALGRRPRHRERAPGSEKTLQLRAGQSGALQIYARHRVFKFHRRYF